MAETTDNNSKRSNKSEGPRQSNQMITRIIDSIGDGIYVVDKDWNFIFVNERIAKMIGHKPSEMVGKNGWQFFPKIVGTIYEKNLLEAMTKGEIRSFEWKGYYSDDIWEIRVYPFEEGLIVCARDVSERKKTEDALKESEERFSKAFYLNPSAMAISNINGQIVDVNVGFERLLGFTKDEIIGEIGCDFGLYAVPNEREELIRQLKEKGHVSNYEISLMHKSGKPVRAIFSLEQITLNDEPHFLGTAIDITERKLLQTQLEEYSKNLEHLVEKKTKQLKDSEHLAAIGATAGMVGHDIRNPLQGIVNDLYLVKKEISEMPKDQTKVIKESLDAIENNIFYINKIVADLQDFAKPLNPRPEQTEIQSLIHEILTRNGFPKSAEVTINVESQAQKVMADPHYLKRIMENLVLNAVQAMPNGGKLTIRSMKDKFTSDIVLTVKDTGVGIPDDVKNKLFTPMFTTKSKGQGFGLSVVKRFTEALGGTVTFESDIGKGTTFTIRLPHKKAQ